MKQRLVIFVLLCVLLSVLLSSSTAALELRGRVVDEQDRPVQGAWVELQPELTLYDRTREIAEGLLFPEPEARVRTSAEGEYLLRVPEPGMWYVEIYADGKIPLRRKLLPLLEDDVLPPAIMKTDVGIEVRIVNSKGEAVPEARIWVNPVYNEDEDYAQRYRGRPVGRTNVWQARGRVGLADEQGRVWLSREAGQTLEAYAFATGYLPTTATPLSANSSTVRLVLGRPMSMRFLTATGDPAREMVVQIGDPPWSCATTDEKGQVVVHLVPDEPVAFGLISANGQVETGTLEASEEELAQGSKDFEQMTLPAPVVLRGRVLDQERQNPIGGAWVWARRDPGNIVLTDRLGHYELIRGSGSRWGLSAAATGFQTTSGTANRNGDDLTPLTLLLARSSVLEGRVVDKEGNGIGWAEVVAHPVDQSVYRGNPPQVWTENDGRFRISGLADTATYQLVVRASGFAEARHPFQPGRTKRVEIVLETGRSLTGRLVSQQGAPIVGAEVALVPTPDGRRQMGYYQRAGHDDPPPTGLTDTEGRFWIENLPETPLALIAQPQGFAFKLVPHIDFEETDPLVDLGDLIMTPGLNLKGIVVDREGDAIAGATIESNRNSYPMYFVESMVRDHLGWQPVMTDDEGHFVLEGYARGEEIGLDVEHTDFMGYQAQGIEPGADSPIEIILDRAAKLSGRVEGDGIEPVAGFRVDAMSRSPVGRPMPSWSFDGERTQRTRTDDDGDFAFESLWPGRVEITGRGAGYITAQPLELDLVPGDEVTGVVLRLQAATELSGRVTDTEGRPVFGASLSIMQLKSSPHNHSARGIGHAGSDAEGRYGFDGLDSKVDGLLIEVRHEGYPHLREPLDLEPGVNTLDLVLETGTKISGFVLSEAGEAVAGASVGLEGGAANYYSGQNRTLSLDDGSFEISGIGPGTYKLFAVKESYARSYLPDPVEISAGSGAQGLTIRLMRGGTIRGRVLGVEPEDLERVSIFARDPEGQHVMGFVDETGEYRVENVAISEGSIGASSTMNSRIVTEEFTLDTAGGETWIDLEFKEDGSTLSGVLRVDGEPIAGVTVMARGGLDNFGWGSTDSSGHFEIQGLDDGGYNLSLRGEISIAEVQIVEVLGATQITIDITSIRIAGRVVAAVSGEPIAAALVFVRGQSNPFGEPTARAETWQSGEFEIYVASGGEPMTLVAQADGYAQKSIPIDKGSGGEISGVELALEAAGELELDVHLASGLRSNYVSVGLIDSNGRGIYAEAIYPFGQQSYRLRSIPPGSWILLVAAEGGATVSVAISVPGPPVSVTLPPEAQIAVDLSGLQGLTGSEKLRLLTPAGTPFPFPIGGRILTEQSLSGSRSLLRWVPAGSWVVELIDASGQLRQQEVTTIAGQTTEVVLN